MKQKINPVMATVAVLALILIAGIFILRAGKTTQVADGEKPPGMPAEAAKEFEQRMGGTKGPDVPTAPAGGSTATPGGYLTPPPH